MNESPIKSKPDTRVVHLPLKLHRRVAALALSRDEFIQNIVQTALKSTFPELDQPLPSEKN